MISLTVAGSLNDDECLVMEDAIQFCVENSAAPNPFTAIYFECGACLNVKESIEEIRDAIQNAGKTSSQAQPQDT